MKNNIIVALFLLFITPLFSLPTFVEEALQENNNKEYSNLKEEHSFVRSLHEFSLKKYERILPSIHLEEKGYYQPVNLTLVGFSWNNCGQPSDPVEVNTLEVSPDPITIPGTETVTLDAVIKTTVETATSLALTIKKKIFGVYIEVPCVDNVGSCTYENPCDMLKNITCPPEFIKLGFTCQCPFAAKDYKLDNVDVKIPAIKLPSFVENGDYEISAKLMNGDSEILCYNVQASLKAD